MTGQVITSVIRIRGINPYILVTASKAATIKPNWRKPLPVLVRINGMPEEPFRTNMMPTGDGSFYLYLHSDMRRVCGTEVGDRVRAEISLDAKYKNGPMHPMPPWFREALRQSSSARSNWRALSPSRQKEILRYLSKLKSPQAKARNLKQAIAVLSGVQGRFMARAWKQGAGTG